MNDKSAMPCGCDPGCGEGYKCERHSSALNASGQVTTGGGEAAGVVTAAVRTGGTASVVKDATWRKQRPLWSGVMNYFPRALLEVAYTSWVGNEQHNPGQHLHWDRSKSTDEKDACARHLSEAGKFDSDGVRHSAKVAWRALANLEKELEQAEG
jgi:hypothetical protein